MNYIPLNVKTHYELLSSLIKIDELIEFIKKSELDAVGITDSNMFGCMEFINACTKSGIKPIVGIPINLDNLNMILYAKNYNGYMNLLNIVSIKNTKNLEHADIKNHNKDLICVTKDYENYLNYKEIYEYVYLSYENEREKKEALIITDKILYLKEGLYINAEEKEYLTYLQMIKDGKTITSNAEYNFNNHINIDIDESDAKTTINFKNLIDIQIPSIHFKLPEYSPNKIDLIKNLCTKGLNKRLNGSVPQIYKERLQMELEVIISMDYTDYFLIVYDFILYAKKHNIIVGPGRGSAAGSLVSYTLGITEIDPIKYNLIFERFLNPERISLPDIDIDIEYLRREELIKYVKDKYGHDKVANIITFGTLLSKQVLRDVGRTLEMPVEVVDKITKTIKDKETFEELKNNELFMSLLNSNEEYKKLVRISKRLEGLKRHTSIHAAGVIISEEPLMNRVPLYKSGETLLTGYSMEYLEPIGLLKMDFLAIKNFTIIGNILEKIKKEKALFIDLNKIPLNDTKTLKLFYDVETTGIFQFESEGMMAFLKNLKVKTFEDLVSAIALYRPGPRESIPEFIAVREGRKKPHYILKEIESILKETNGIIVYQEQILEILKKVGGFSYSTADNIRRAMSKKKEAVIISYKEEFIKGALTKGYKKEDANEIYNLVLKFANYGFNKSHSVAYSLIAYQMAFLKAHFPEYYMTTELDMVIGSSIKTKEYIDEARRFNLEVYGVDINISKDFYKIDNNKIILPLSAIKNIGKESLLHIIEERKKGKFNDYFDFIRRIYSSKTNSKAIESLILSGSLDKFGLNRKTMIENLPSAIDYANVCSKIDESLVEKPEIIYQEEYMDNEILKNEYDIFGFYIKNHPLTRYKRDNMCKLKDIEKYFDKIINVLVLIDVLKETQTKKKEKMAFLTVSDEDTKITVVAFPNTYISAFGIKKGDIVKINGKVERRMNSYQLVANKIEKV